MVAARESWGEVVDYPFPAVDAAAGEDEILVLAQGIVDDIASQHGTDGIAVHVMGEFCLTHALIAMLEARGITCVASTSRRMVHETAPGHKVVEFKFVRFRRY